MSVMEVGQSLIESQAEETPSGFDALDEQLLGQLVGRTKERGVKLAGEGGLLQALTKRLLESALEGEITDYLGYAKHDTAGDNSGNSRNGRRAKTVLTDIGLVCPWTRQNPQWRSRSIPSCGQETHPFTDM